MMSNSIGRVGGLVAIATFATVLLGSEQLRAAEPMTIQNDLDAALYADASIIAPAMGWDISYAVLRLHHQQEFSRFLHELLAKYPDRFAGGYTVNGRTFASTILFKGAIPDGVLDELRVRDIDADVRGGATFSLEELQAASDGLHADLMRAGFVAGTGYSVEANRVDAYVQRPPSLAGRSDVDALATLPESARAEMVDITFSDSPIVVPAANVYGGGMLADDTVFECTSGFAVAKNGTTGLLTAAHCQGLNQYKAPGPIFYSMTFQNEHMSTWGDMEWHTTTATETAEFWVSTSTRRLVHSMQAG